MKSRNPLPFDLDYIDGHDQCPEPEVRAHRAANAIANFGFKGGTRIIELLVVLGFRSSHENVPRNDANFGIGPLVGGHAGGRPDCRFPSREKYLRHQRMSALTVVFD